MRQWAAGLVIGLLAAPGALAAQDVCGGAVKAPGKGGWSEYVVNSPRARSASTVRYAVVGTEARQGKNHLRLETRVQNSERTFTALTQVVVPGFPYEQEAIQEVVVQQGNRPAARWGPSLLVQARSSPRAPLTQLIVDACTGSRLVGEEQVTVPAGAFTTRHYRNAAAGSDIWVSEEVPFGIVKVTGLNGATMELMARGTGAGSSVKGEPVLTNVPG